MDSRKVYDVIVVGSGAAGSIAVKELTERGLDVLMLEAGRDLTPADFTPPDTPKAFVAGPGIMGRLRGILGGQHVQSMRGFYSEQVNHLLVNDRENPYSSPRDARFMWIRARILGGRLNTYGRVLNRMSDHDFKAAAADGQGADWPITYAELAPFYDSVEQTIGVYGDADGSDVIPDGTYVGKPMLTAPEQDLKRAVEGTWSDRKVISWRYAAPNPDRVPRGVVAARKTGRLTTRTDAVVSRVITDAVTGRATGVEFVDRVEKTTHVANADVVMLCAGAIESVRIMLNSKGVKHPNGLGNAHDLVGRYFMDQVPTMTFASIPGRTGWTPDTSAPADPFYAPAGGVFIPRYRNLGSPSTPGFFRGFSFQGAIGRFPTPEGTPSVGGLMGFGEMLPHFDNRITLTKRTDAWGLPTPHIRCAMTGNEEALAITQLKDVREMLETANFHVDFSGSTRGLDSKDFWKDKDPFTRLVFRFGFPMSMRIGASIHECGGARMGSDPATSVLNEHNQVWDAPNVFVTDGACFASAGSVGPTLTLMALSARAAAFIAQQHESGALTR